jgi:hypothetical protein
MLGQKRLEAKLLDHCRFTMVNFGQLFTLDTATVRKNETKKKTQFTCKDDGVVAVFSSPESLFFHRFPILLGIDKN